MAEGGSRFGNPGIVSTFAVTISPVTPSPRVTPRTKCVVICTPHNPAATIVRRRPLERFLDQVSLVSDLDSAELRNDRVSLMTVHSAKGLEFPIVFILGMEEGIFPHSRSLDPRWSSRCTSSSSRASAAK